VVKIDANCRRQRSALKVKLGNDRPLRVLRLLSRNLRKIGTVLAGSCHKRQKPQAPTPQAPIRNRQTRKVANAKGLNRITNLA